MSEHIGIWISHGGAQIVRLTDDEAQLPLLTEIKSDVESHHKSFGGSGISLPAHVGGSVETHFGRRREGHLARFYQQVADLASSADAIVLLGPGEAKQEFLRHLKTHDKHHLAAKIIADEPCDRLTNKQLIAIVRDRIVQHRLRHTHQAVASAG